MAGLRVSVDTRSEKIGYKIREAQLHKIPYMLVIGEKEVESGTVSVRKRGEGDIGAMSIADFVDSAKTDVAEKTNKKKKQKNLHSGAVYNILCTEPDLFLFAEKFFGICPQKVAQNYCAI